ncbi:MarR family transcriptional regulator [Candidatus Micrarchaeota archaeon]|nr:MarR family transcriptional regulator [Candidatus Micrarchaeota archaeon]
MDEKELWGIVFVFAILLSVIIIYYDQTLESLGASSCTFTDAQCPHAKSAAVEATIIILLLAIIVGGTGFFFARAFLAKKVPPTPVGPNHNVAVKFVPKDSSELDEDSKKVYDFISENGGSVFQGEIIRETGFAKVTVTRILDKLEMQGFIERKRRGMSNIVVAK